MHGSGNHKRRRCHNSLSSHLADDVTTIVTPVSGWRRAMGRSKLQQRYYDPKRVGSYGGVAALRRVVPEQDVERWLSEQDTYTLHKPVRRRFKRRCVVVGGPNQQWQADLVDMSRLKKVNDGTTFILTVIDVFSKLAYNGTYHRSIGMAPSEVTSTNQETVWQRLYGHESVGTPKFRVGNRVRISKAKRHFEKGYMANWTEELFTIVDAHRSDPPVYRLADCHGDKLDGTFYEPELQKVVVPKGKTYRVESILRWRNKRREVLVKWSGYPTSFNSWIDAKTLVNY